MPLEAVHQYKFQGLLSLKILQICIVRKIHCGCMSKVFSEMAPRECAWKFDLKVTLVQV